jgi:hypothetical protein
MDFQEFELLNTTEQEKWLNDRLEEGLAPEEIYAALSTTKQAMGKIGIFYVPPKKSFNIKPMRGYQTTKFSGNEGADGVAIIGGERIE